MRPFYLLVALLLLACSPLAAQESGEKTSGQPEPARPDHTVRARPHLKKELKWQKADRTPYAVGGPVNTEFGLFINSNTIVENSVAAQNESSIAINPLNPNVLIASAVDSRGAVVYISTDGGLSWRNHNFGSVNTNWQTGNDPSVAFDYLGNGYVMYGAFPRTIGTPTGQSGVYVAKTTDNGATWQPHIVVIEHKGTMTPDSAFEDKYYIEIDNSPTSPRRGYMYTPWKRVIDRDNSTQIVVARSIDGGLTWGEPVQVSPRKPGTSLDTTFGQSFPITTTGPDGTLYVCWNDGPIRSIGFAKSTDGGLTFTAPSYPVQGYPTLGTTRRVGQDVYHVLKGTFRAETYPTLMADNSNSPRRGWLYLAWAAGLHPDVYFSRSTDGGESWSQPKVIHSDPRNDQWWPWLSVDETTGDIAVMYSDSRNDPENIFIDAYVSYSSDGGDTWIDRRATDTMSDFRETLYENGIFAGDYSGNAFHAGKIYPSFLDTRQDNDVFTVIVDLRKPYPVENLAVRGRYGSPGEATLTWTNPPMETTFGLPITDYSLLLSRDGAVIATLPAGTTSYPQTGLTEGQLYNYSVRVVVGADTSVRRDVEFNYNSLKRPAAADIVEKRDFNAAIELEVKLPSVRADEVTPLENLEGYRLYRDGVMIRESALEAADTGRTIVIGDTPPERGYYTYWVSVIDASDPANESVASDTATLYAGPFTPYTENFDAATPRFIYNGRWGETPQLALSGSKSVTDSPTGVYFPNRSTYLQIYPVSASGPIGLNFAHIAIVAPGDTALVEASFDRGASWTPLAAYDEKRDAAWADRTASPGDWRHESISIYHPQPGAGSTVVVRFRLITSSVTNTDGWYIDDISFGGPASADRTEDAAFASRAYPNPARHAAIIEYTLPSAADVSIRLFDVMGREIAHPLDARQQAGNHSITFDGSALPNGVYMYEITAGGNLERGRIVFGR